MTAEEFEFLLQMVGPIITKQHTKMRRAISPRDRLSVTLQFLATGGSARAISAIATALTSLLVCILSFISYAGKKFNSLSAQYRLGASTISQIVMETCGALYQLMKKDFLKVSSDYNHLLKYSAHLLLGTFQ